MVGRDPKQEPGTKRRPRFMTTWILTLVILCVATAYFYSQYQQTRSNFLNSHYFRTLHEASRHFNDRLKQLSVLHEYGEDEANIRALFSSYNSRKGTNHDKNKDGAKAIECFVLDGETLRFGFSDRASEEVENVSKEADCEKAAYIGQIAIRDILPVPAKEIILLLVVDSDNKVLVRSGDSSALSFTDTNEISAQIYERKQQRWADLATGEGRAKPSTVPPLPGQSFQIDMEMMSRNFRIFIYPFNPYKPILISDEKTVSNQNKNADRATNNALFLVAVVPQSQLDIKENQRWNLSLLILCLVFLGFVWTMLRLFLLSHNQSIGEIFYRSTMICSYALFVVVVALLLAFGEQRVETAFKEMKARALINHMAYTVDQELFEIFTGLKKYQDYFVDLITSIEKVTGDNFVTSCKGGYKQRNAVPETLLPVVNSLLTVPSPRGVKENHYDYSQRVVLRGSRFSNLENISSRQFIWPLKEIASALLDICAEEKEDTGTFDAINLFGQGSHFIPTEPYGQWFKSVNSPQPNLLNVFLMNHQGKMTLPMFYYRENNKAPARYELGHREYFKKVRNQQGWVAELNTIDPPDQFPVLACRSSKTFSNFYIQRLFNLTSGTRGTTIGMPLVFPEEQIDKNFGENKSMTEDFFLGADILLSSLTLTEWVDPDRLLDMTVMVVDRDNGDVLFHMDNDRALVENLFRHGQGTLALSHKIRAGLEPKDRPVPGYYHGTPGGFLFKYLPIKQWVLLAFIPDDSTDSYMTNLFLQIGLSMTLAISIIAAVIFVISKFVNTGLLKTNFNIPLVIDRRKIILFSSVFVASVYLGYWLGTAVDRGNVNVINASVLLPFLAMSGCLLWGYHEYRNYYACSRQKLRDPIPSNQGAVFLIILFLISGGILTTYLHRVGMLPIGALDWYYESKLYPARQNQELLELNQIALSLYPNSITRYQVNPLDLMPISDQWKKKLSTVDNSSTTPVDIGEFSELTFATSAAEWINRYLLNGVPNFSTPCEKWVNTYLLNTCKSESDFFRPGIKPLYFILMITSFILVCVLWVTFNRRILSVRVFGSSSLLRHLNQIVSVQPRGDHNLPDKDLIIDLANKPKRGFNVGHLLRQRKQDVPCFAELCHQCPSLHLNDAQDNRFPGMNIRITAQKTAIDVELSNLDTCLAQDDQRSLLLRLICELKARRIAGQILRLTIYSNFQWLEKLCLKANTLSTDNKNHNLTPAEYFAWSECLRDFRIRVPPDLLTHIDQQFVQRECEALPFLKYITDEMKTSPEPVGKQTPLNFLRWLELKDRQKTLAEWASINFILIKAASQYRFKWESCSSAEKLALYYLALNKRISPLNSLMLEELALKGLIKIRRGRVRIVNQSFAYFVRHAEDEDTLKSLVQVGDVGAWQDYRTPVTLMIMLVIGGIALTSGNSLYLIAASLLGILGTIGSLINSASLIRNTLQK